MQTDAKLWRRLKVNDRVRLVHMPTPYSDPNRGLHPDTRRAYEKLIKRNRPLRVYKVDKWKRPWVRFQFRLRNGKFEYHGLQIDHDGLVLVRSRTKVTGISDGANSKRASSRRA
jgi:hypothetical protein